MKKNSSFVSQQKLIVRPPSPRIATPAGNGNNCCKREIDIFTAASVSSRGTKTVFVAADDKDSEEENGGKTD